MPLARVESGSSTALSDEPTASLGGEFAGVRHTPKQAGSTSAAGEVKLHPSGVTGVALAPPFTAPVARVRRCRRLPTREILEIGNGTAASTPSRAPLPLLVHGSAQPTGHVS